MFVIAAVNGANYYFEVWVWVWGGVWGDVFVWGMNGVRVVMVARAHIHMIFTIPR